MVRFFSIIFSIVPEASVKVNEVSVNERMNRIVSGKYIHKCPNSMLNIKEIGAPLEAKIFFCKEMKYLN